MTTADVYRHGAAALDWGKSASTCVDRACTAPARTERNGSVSHETGLCERHYWLEVLDDARDTAEALRAEGICDVRWGNPA